MYEVVETCGEWFVRVVEEDQELTRSFEVQAFALAFAEGQRQTPRSCRLQADVAPDSVSGLFASDGQLYGQANSR